MIRALRVLVDAVRVVGGRPGPAILNNLVAVAFSLPLLFVLSGVAGATSLSILPLGAAGLVGILSCPAMTGLQVAARGWREGEILPLRAQWDAIRRSWHATLPAWLIGLVVGGILLVNASFYSRHGATSLGPFAGAISVIWLCGFAFWLAIHLYVFPLLLRQDGLRIRDAYRNAAVISLGRPLYTLFLTVVWIAWLIVACTTGLAYVFGLALAAVIQEQAVSHILPTFDRETPVAG